MTEKNTTPFRTSISRRRFLAGGAAVAATAGLAGVLPAALSRAAGAAPKTFDLSQVRHLVYVMMENRSFDHYFGTFPGARGFSDPRAMRLPNGDSVFRQPDPSNPAGYLMPWHMSTIDSGAAAVPSLAHDWRDQHASWNNGSMDHWMLTHLGADGAANGPFTMGYYTREDIPFHWSLAENFTLLDHYFCSVLGPTDPNRMVWSCGSNDPRGEYGGPVLETVAPNPLTLPSAPEILHDAGYRVKAYFATGASGLNAFAWFANFKAKGILPDGLHNAIMAGGTLYGDGTPGGVGDPANPTPATVSSLAFEEDCANGVLPDVSWLFMPAPADEHPPYLPAAGAQYLASKLEALAGNEDLWSSTVFVLNYDENDGFFDHVPPPVPDPARYPEEYVTKASPKGTPGGGLPVGAGFRVPCLIVSPWTVGGHIYSSTADHTSPLRFIEAVTAAGGLAGHGPVRFTPISRWRRATFDDLTGALRPGAPVPDAARSAFDPVTAAANLAAQTEAATKPMPEWPGRTREMPRKAGK